MCTVMHEYLFLYISLHKISVVRLLLFHFIKMEGNETYIHVNCSHSIPFSDVPKLDIKIHEVHKSLLIVTTDSSCLYICNYFPLNTDTHL